MRWPLRWQLALLTAALVLVVLFCVGAAACWQLNRQGIHDLDHELRHVDQFLEDKAFPLSYLWQSIRYGYTRNAYEVDARRYSASRLDTAEKEL